MASQGSPTRKQLYACSVPARVTLGSNTPQPMILSCSYESYFSFPSQPSGPAAPSVLPLLPKWLSQSSLSSKLCSWNRKLLFPSSLYHLFPHPSLQEQEAFTSEGSYAPTSLGTYRPEPWRTHKNCLQNYSGSSLQSTSSMLKCRDTRGH